MLCSQQQPSATLLLLLLLLLPPLMLMLWLMLWLLLLLLLLTCASAGESFGERLVSVGIGKAWAVPVVGVVLRVACSCAMCGHVQVLIRR